MIFYVCKVLLISVVDIDEVFIERFSVPASQANFVLQ